MRPFTRMKSLDRRRLVGVRDITSVMDPVRDDATIWRVTLDRHRDELEECAAVLSVDEKRRARRFRFEQDCDRFTVCRAVLRQLLAQELAIDACKVDIVYGRYGKPLLPPLAGRRVSFNVSHSDGQALVALASHEVGVDIERIRPVDDLVRLAKTALSLTEQAALFALPGPQRLKGFFNCWTRKEAYIKATGYGLSRPLDEFDVTLAPGERARLAYVKDGPHEPTRWSMSSGEPLDGYKAAVCIKRPSR